MRTKIWLAMLSGFTMSLLVLVSCGGGGGGGGVAGTNPTYTVSGMITGLTGTAVLQNSGGDDLQLVTNGSFTFSAALADGSTYAVMVKTQPAGRTCTASKNTGRISGANIVDVVVTCSSTTYTVGGMVSGLTGTAMLQINGTNELELSTNGAFVFTDPVANGSGYSIAVKNQPAEQICTLNSNTGAVSGSNVTNVTVACIAAHGTFIKTVKPLTYSTPFSSLPLVGAGSRSQVLYLANMINGSGNIQSIAFRFNTDHTAIYTCATITIKMEETIVSSLSGTFADNVGQGGSNVRVFSSPVTVPTGSAGDTFTMTLDVPFTYSGANNLLLDITGNTCSGTSPDFRAWRVDHNAVIYGGGATAGGSSAWLNETLFKFKGGENTVLFTDDGTTGALNAIPFSPLVQSRKVQLLYTAQEVNGSGTINGIAFPIGTNPRNGVTITADYTVNIKLGHTLLSSLTTTFADNFNSGLPADLASAATFTIPAGLQDGTFVWLPVPSGVFSYNGTDNLLVEIEITAASAQSFWLAGDSVGAGMRVDGAQGGVAGTVGTQHYNIRFKF